MKADWQRIQRWAGVPDDGDPGPVTARGIIAKAQISDDGGSPLLDRAEFLARYVNRTAPAIDDDDRVAAARKLGVTLKHIRMIEKVESAGRSFDDVGRPVILPEPHVFHRLTEGRFGVTAFSYPKWGTMPYPSTYDARWKVLADMAERDEAAALQSASWGLFQVMGFHWKVCGYESPYAFAAGMAGNEDDHLEAMVGFVDAENLEDDLLACRADDPESCRPFARGYNGAGYAKNNYHIKMAAALR